MRAAARLPLEHGLRLRHYGRAHVPARGAALLVANHPTYLDPWLVAYGVRRWVTWMAWEEAFSWPVIGWLVRSMGAFPVNTDRPAPSSYKAALEVLAQGRLLGIFFEGGRTRENEFGVDPPRAGAARLALRAGVPVVPVSIAGARRAWPLHRRLPRPGRVCVYFHPPIDPRQVEGRHAREREARLNDQLLRTIAAALPPDGRHRPRRR
ncbi:MAG: 1-acyl-sn-glycerol-3-phosphate acyltransferase [Planctomycetota bacterium]|nr:MAG: 1-acyl-sn-glycerol-3-phosphate acyltransferase [Planctomycetota bacterium]